MDEEVIRHLNVLLRGEISAVETYREAFAKVAHFPEKHELVECQRSHEQRVQLLRQRILMMGGNPVETSGLWGTFARVVENAAAALGDRLALAALEEGEDHGLRDYKHALDALRGDVRTLVETELLPEQEKTHDIMKALKRHPPQ